MISKILPDFQEKPIYAPGKKGDIRKIYLDTEKAKNELGWQAKVQLEDGLKKNSKMVQKT